MTIDVLDILILFLLLPFIIGYIRRAFRQAFITSLKRSIARERGSRFITLIHPQPPSGLFSFLMPNYIDIEDAQRIIEAIRTTPKDKPIDILLHTPGGLVIASQQIAEALASHPAKVTAYVPYYAMSGGTLVTLAADEIMMGENALLGRLDPQFFGASAASITAAVSKKEVNKVDDTTLILADISEKALRQIRIIVESVLKKRGYDEEQIKGIMEELTFGKHTHDFPIHFEEAKKLGMRVSVGIPKEMYALIKLYAGPRRHQ